MRIRALFFLFAVVFTPFVSVEAEVISELWQTEKSQHFIVHEQGASKWLVDKLINQAEQYYNSILDDLGYRRFDFWTWEKRAKIYLHKDVEGYQAETQRFAWSGAMVHVESRTIKTFVDQEHFFDSMLPHEMTHIIFREFIGDKPDLPLWIDEGVACSQEKSTLGERMKIARQLLRESKYINLDELSKVTYSLTLSPEVFYSEAASLIVFLLRQYGRDRFFEFSRQLRDGKNWLEALKSVYRFDSLEDMETKWKSFMLKI